jgi:hypothetical protein
MSRYICFTKLKHLIFINGGSSSLTRFDTFRQKVEACRENLGHYIQVVLLNSFGIKPTSIVAAAGWLQKLRPKESTLLLA